jgi:hypothetical protein
MTSLVVRACAAWLLLLIVAVLNGTLRQALLVPAFGEHTGHLVSTLMLSTLIFVVAWLLSAWLDIVSLREAGLVGGLWIVLTVAFEFLAGHFLFGASWSKLLADIVTAITSSLVFRMER